MENYNTTQAYITALTGDPNTVVDFRCIHDTDKAVPGKAIRGTLVDNYETLQSYNQNGYGIFCCINAMDGQGRNLANVEHIRTHIVDLDNPLSAQASYEAAVSSNMIPHFGVQTSPGKYHLYWLVEPYQGNDFYSTQQRKLRQIYDGDRSVIDASRVLRVPGFLHLKDPQNPYMVSCWQITDAPRYNFQQIEQSLAHINVFDNTGGRFELGEESLQAPSLDWLRFALSKVNPADLSYEEWMSLTAAYKQSGWSLADEQTLLNIWLEWCALYHENDEGTNMKLWNSIRDTEIGWASMKRRTSVDAYINFGHKEPPAIQQQPVQQQQPMQQTPAMPEPDEVDPASFGEILSEHEQPMWFKNCYYIAREGKIFSTTARFMNSTTFNGLYGGKHFIITSTGKTTDEAWKAATRSTLWTVPKVDHVRFLPSEPSFSIIEDDMGRQGLNTYIPARVTHSHGDVTPWLRHVQIMIPDPNDQKIWFDYLAHCVKYPGHKIPWAPMLQSMEGVGKSVFTAVMTHALGSSYVYQPKAPELVASGSKFNAWMRAKLMIIVDEIRVDERRELIEILKPMITEARVEIQAKGVDQEMEDNVANWLFFSNYPDAIPVNEKGRRYAIFYSAIQNSQDLINAGLNKEYFDYLWSWLNDQNGLEYVTQWLLDYPIEKGEIAVRAPQTTSHAKAIELSRSPMEVEIIQAVEDGIAGFRGGYVSTIALKNRCKLAGLRAPSLRAMQTCLEDMGYYPIGKPPRPYAQDDVHVKPLIYGRERGLDVNQYGRAQGYE